MDLATKLETRTSGARGIRRFVGGFYLAVMVPAARAEWPLAAAQPLEGHRAQTTR